MKALTIKEPWATLIIDGYKKYEFRYKLYTKKSKDVYIFS